MNAHRVTEDELHAYVDGQLDAHRRVAVERWLADDPEAAARAQNYRLQAALLHDLFDPVLREPVVPEVEDLTDRLRGRIVVNDNAPAWYANPWMRSAAAVALVVGGLAGGWMGRSAVEEPVVQQAAQPQRHETLAGFAEEATQAHRFYTSEERFQVELGADNQEELNSWLSKRVGRDVFGPDLSRAGYRLIGGRSLPTEVGAGAQYMYTTDNGKRITLFVGAPRSGANNSFSFTQKGDIATFYWVEGNLAYALAGPLSKEELLEIAKAVYNDVKAGPPRRGQPGDQGKPQDQPQGEQQNNGLQPVSNPIHPKES